LGEKPPSAAVNQKAAAASRTTRRLRSIEGRCELLVEGERAPRSCAEVKLIARSTSKGEMRIGVVDGFAVTFPDINHDSYKLTATSENYQLTTDSKELEAGQKVLIRLRAKPISR